MGKPERKMEEKKVMNKWGWGFTGLVSRKNKINEVFRFNFHRHL